MGSNKRYVDIEGGDFKLQQEAAAVLAGVSVQSIQKWHKSPNPPPRNEDGSYSAREFTDYLILKRTQQHVNRVSAAKGDQDGMPEVGESYRDAETRLKRAQADKIEMDNEVSRGNLVSVRDVETAWSRILIRVKTGFLSLPSKLSAELSRETEAHACQTLLGQSIRDVLSELSEDWRDEDVGNDSEDN